MPVLGLHHYNLRAHRALLDELRDFYVDVVGLVQGERPPFKSFGYWLYAGPDAVLHLSQAGPQEDRPARHSGTFDHVALRSADADAFVARLQRHGVAYTLDRVPRTGALQIFFSDPAGNGIELNFDETPR